MFRAVGINEAEANRGPVFVDSNGVIEAAVSGKGISLVRKMLVREEIEKGLLINPLSTAVETSLAYYLVYDESATLQRISRHFRDWIVAVAKAENDLI